MHPEWTQEKGRLQGAVRAVLAPCSIHPFQHHLPVSFHISSMLPTRKSHHKMQCPKSEHPTTTADDWDFSTDTNQPQAQYHLFTYLQMRIRKSGCQGQGPLCPRLRSCPLPFTAHRVLIYQELKRRAEDAIWGKGTGLWRHQQEAISQASR